MAGLTSMYCDAPATVQPSAGSVQTVTAIGVLLALGDPEASEAPACEVTDTPAPVVPVDDELPWLSASARMPPIAAATATPLAVSTIQCPPERRVCGVVNCMGTGVGTGVTGCPAATPGGVPIPRGVPMPG